MGSDRALVGIFNRRSGFNPRSRVGSDHIGGREFDAVFVVSIRAPAWGATASKSPNKALEEVSIRAPAWGATASINSSASESSVSIRAPAWGATHQLLIIQIAHVVSIRAPAWGATRSFARQRTNRSCFNPRSRVGSDLERDGLTPGRTGSFNPRSRVGSDRARPKPSCRSRCFNPRSRVGSDRLPGAPC